MIPARNAERTLEQCLAAVAPMLGRGELEEILVVDDGSTDRTQAIAGKFSASVLVSGGLGPSGARNLGWREGQGDLIWFIDADCVARPDSLERLRRHMDEPSVAGVGGSYDNMEPGSLLACLIHEEIHQRHLAVGEDVDYLGSFNVLYRKAALERVGGFDERLIAAEDADLSYRLTDVGADLRFELQSRVGHYHPTRLLPYLKIQMRHGVWATRMYRRHPGRARGNSYSGALDHVQPPLAILTLASTAAFALPGWGWAPVVLLAGLLGAQIPMTRRMVDRTGDVRMLLMAPLGAVRAFARGFGLVQGLPAAL